jgi:hypothetical protein
MLVAELRRRGNKALQIIGVVKVDILFVFFGHGL